MHPALPLYALIHIKHFVNDTAFIFMEGAPVKWNSEIKGGTASTPMHCRPGVCDGGSCGRCQGQPLPLKTAGLEAELKKRRGESHLDDIKEVA